MTSIAAAFDDLDREYILQEPDRNPPKTFIPLSDGADRYFNQMAAVLSDGTFGGKMVFVDELAGKLGGKIVVYDRDMRLVTECDAERITAIRCGLMAALAIHRFYQSSAPFYRNLMIGFIGNGRINQATAKVLNALWGCWNFRLCGSPAAPGRNAGSFPGLKSIALDKGRLSDCDVVISCTNNNDQAAMVEADQIDGPELFIAQDSGWMLGPSFRRRYASFTDNVEQLNKAMSHEFPFDPEPPVIAGDLNTYKFGRNEKACVYLYGIALADVVTARALAPLLDEAERSIAA